MISNISIHPKTMFKNALNIHNFSFKNHTSTAIIGTNGAGKSTLINTILGIRSDYNFKAQNNNIPYHDNVIPQRKQLGVVSNLFNYPPGLNANDLFKFYQFFHKNNGNIAQYKPLNSILKSVAKTFNFKEKPTTKDLLALLKDI
ncbi:ATP-binding cassette domain-containing protein [Helicobacter pylori]|uniref:ATP-binding cassette domain-containing protein n=1 Tax=Helicobacter pylori TaxID=210 RepID=UPI000EB43B56|nr:ATP-binding cassette domain-containing protein [Helicobacter pylori]